MSNKSDFVKNYMEFCENIMSEMLRNENNKNFFVSPVSIYVILTMLACCSEGTTRNEIMAVLGSDKEIGNIVLPLKNIIAEIRESGHGKLSEVNLLAVNSRWSDKINYQTVEQFEKDFNADFFEDENLVNSVNSWVSKKTNGMIKNILSPDSIADIVLFSSAIFMAEWKQKYKPWNVRSGRIFINANGNEENATYMSSTETMGIQWNGWIGFTKAYKNTPFEFMALLPENDTVKLETLLNGNFWGSFCDIYSSARTMKVYCTIPEFEISYDCCLNNILNELGIKKTFTKKADLTPIISVPESYVDKIKHNAYVKVDSSGTKATGYAEIGVPAGGPPDSDPNYIVVDLERPFVFAIMYKNTGIPVFLGVTNSVGDAAEKYDIDDWTTRYSDTCN